MLTKLRKIAVAAAMAGLIGTATVAVPDTAHARWGGGWQEAGGMEAAGAAVVVGAGVVSAWV